MNGTYYLAEIAIAIVTFFQYNILIGYLGILHHIPLSHLSPSPPRSFSTPVTPQKRKIIKTKMKKKANKTPTSLICDAHIIRVRSSLPVASPLKKTVQLLVVVHTFDPST